MPLLFLHHHHHHYQPEVWYCVAIALHGPQECLGEGKSLALSTLSKFAALFFLPLQNLVHTMLADQLNNSGWPERWTACNLLPKLHGGICKDHSSKLLLLAWDDWSPEVRQAAAKAIGLIGLGKVCV